MREMTKGPLTAVPFCAGSDVLCLDWSHQPHVSQDEVEVGLGE